MQAELCRNVQECARMCKFCLVYIVNVFFENVKYQLFRQKDGALTNEMVLSFTRPPDVCATNCATSRSLLKRECKGRQIAGYCQIYTLVFDKKSYLALFSPILIMWFAFFLLNLQIQTDAA